MKIDEQLLRSSPSTLNSVLIGEVDGDGVWRLGDFGSGGERSLLLHIEKLLAKKYDSSSCSALLALTAKG